MSAPLTRPRPVRRQLSQLDSRYPPPPRSAPDQPRRMVRGAGPTLLLSTTGGRRRSRVTLGRGADASRRETAEARKKGSRSRTPGKFVPPRPRPPLQPTAALGARGRVGRRPTVETVEAGRRPGHARGGRRVRDGVTGDEVVAPPHALEGVLASGPAARARARPSPAPAPETPRAAWAREPVLSSGGPARAGPGARVGRGGGRVPPVSPSPAPASSPGLPRPSLVLPRCVARVRLRDTQAPGPPFAPSAAGLRPTAPPQTPRRHRPAPRRA